MLRRDKPGEHGLLWRVADNVLYHGQDPFHPRRMPRRFLGEHILHIDAEMHGSHAQWSERKDCIHVSPTPLSTCRHSSATPMTDGTSDVSLCPAVHPCSAPRKSHH